MVGAFIAAIVLLLIVGGKPETITDMPQPSPGLAPTAPAPTPSEEAAYQRELDQLFSRYTVGEVNDPRNRDEIIKEMKRAADRTGVNS